MLSVNSLHFRYSSQQPWLLRSIDLKASAGERIALLGPSGCGKSTLLRCLAGLLPTESGQVTWHQNDHGKNSLPSWGFVFQEPELLPWRNVLQNVALPLRLGHLADTISREQAERTALQQIEQVGLSHAAHLYPAQMSPGMRMRASLARALVNQPSVLFLDEPLAAVDEWSREQLQDLLLALTRDNTQLTWILVTHSVAEAAWMCNRAVVMNTKGGISQDWKFTSEMPDPSDPSDPSDLSDPAPILSVTRESTAQQLRQGELRKALRQVTQ